MSVKKQISEIYTIKNRLVKFLFILRGCLHKKFVKKFVLSFYVLLISRTPVYIKKRNLENHTFILSYFLTHFDIISQHNTLHHITAQHSTSQHNTHCLYENNKRFDNKDSNLIVKIENNRSNKQYLNQ